MSNTSVQCYRLILKAVRSNLLMTQEHKGVHAYLPFSWRLRLGPSFWPAWACSNVTSIEWLTKITVVCFAARKWRCYKQGPSAHAPYRTHVFAYSIPAFLFSTRVFSFWTHVFKYRTHMFKYRTHVLKYRTHVFRYRTHVFRYRTYVYMCSACVQI